MATETTVIGADDHPLFREALVHAVKRRVDGARIVEAESLESLQQAVDGNPDADLLLLDLQMPGVKGFSALAYLRNKHESLPTVVVSAFEQEEIVRRAISHGASGYIPKSSPISVMETAICAVLEGEVWLPDGIGLSDEALPSKAASIAALIGTLTPHQFRVLLMLGEGLMNKQIAYQLGVSEATIKAHVTAILRKLRVTNRTQAVVAVQQLQVDSALEESAHGG